MNTMFYVRRRGAPREWMVVGDEIKGGWIWGETSNSTPLDLSKATRLAKRHEGEVCDAARHPLVQLPIIHSNGSGYKNLVGDLEPAEDALRLAIEKLSATGPNGRDYYPEGPDAFTRASEQHAERCRKLRSVLEDLETIHEHVQDVEDARLASRRTYP
jgi:hypothetical protein